MTLTWQPNSETAVFAYLRRQTSEIFYYRTAEDKGTDFVVLMPDQTMHLFQVCHSMQDLKTREREISALSNAMQELKLSKGTIITLDETDEINISQGMISIIPVWQIFLNI